MHLKIETSHGFILRVRPLTDSSWIVHWLTAEFGRLATVAKGARQPKSPFAGKLDLAFECDLSFQRARRSELHLLREVTLTDSRPIFRTDYACLRQLAYVVALLEQMTETDTPLPEVYTLFAEFVTHLAAHPPQPRNIYAFELKLLATQGMEPDLDEHPLPPSARTLITRLLDATWDELLTLRATADDVRAVRQFLHGFLIFHAGKLALGRAAALDTAAA